MKRSIFAAGALSVGIVFFANVAGADAIKEGQWSMTTTIQMEGMDDQANEAMQEMENMSAEDRAMMERMMGGMGMNMGAQGGGMGITTTITQCITNDNPVPQASEDEDCQTTHNVRGNTVSFESVCEDSHSTGKITYKNDTMQGTIQSTSTEGGKEQNSTIDISGEYVGPCGQPVSPEISNKAKRGLKNQELQDAASERQLPSDSSEPNLDDEDNTGNSDSKLKNAFGGLKSLLGR